jgi:tripartite-type tricarboxylate transporter receptor subunit TctC
MMKRISVTLVALILVTVTSTAVKSYPERTVTIVVPAAAGGVTDFVARMLAKNLTEKVGKDFIVENRPGGGTLTGANVVAKATPDGHSLLVMPLGTILNSILSKTIPVNFETGLVPVSVIADQSLVLVVNPKQLPVSNIKELVAYAKAHPNKISFGTVGPGSLFDVAVQLIMKMTDTKMVGIPYRGSAPALTDLLSGRIQLQAMPLGRALPHINTGKLRALGVTGPTRDSATPNIPSIGETLPGYSVPTWQSLMITAGTPEKIIDQLNNDVHDITAKPDVLKSFKRLHLRRRPPVSAAKDKAFILSEFKKWQTFLREIGLAK